MRITISIGQKVLQQSATELHCVHIFVYNPFNQNAHVTKNMAWVKNTTIKVLKRACFPDFVIRKAIAASKCIFSQENENWELVS